MFGPEALEDIASDAEDESEDNVLGEVVEAETIEAGIREVPEVEAAGAADEVCVDLASSPSCRSWENFFLRGHRALEIDGTVSLH